MAKSSVKELADRASKTCLEDIDKHKEEWSSDERANARLETMISQHGLKRKLANGAGIQLHDPQSLRSTLRRVAVYSSKNPSKETSNLRFLFKHGSEILQHTYLDSIEYHNDESDGGSSPCAGSNRSSDVGASPEPTNDSGERSETAIRGPIVTAVPRSPLHPQEANKKREAVEEAAATITENGRSIEDVTSESPKRQRMSHGKQSTSQIQSPQRFGQEEVAQEQIPSPALVLEDQVGVRSGNQPDLAITEAGDAASANQCGNIEVRRAAILQAGAITDKGLFGTEVSFSTAPTLISNREIVNEMEAIHNDIRKFCLARLVDNGVDHEGRPNLHFEVPPDLEPLLKAAFGGSDQWMQRMLQLRTTKGFTVVKMLRALVGVAVWQRILLAKLPWSDILPSATFAALGGRFNHIKTTLENSIVSAVSSELESDEFHRTRMSPVTKELCNLILFTTQSFVEGQKTSKKFTVPLGTDSDSILRRDYSKLGEVIQRALKLRTKLDMAPGNYTFTWPGFAVSLDRRTMEESNPSKGGEQEVTMTLMAAVRVQGEGAEVKTISKAWVVTRRMK